MVIRINNLEKIHKLNVRKVSKGSIIIFTTVKREWKRKTSWKMKNANWTLTYSHN